MATVTVTVPQYKPGDRVQYVGSDLALRGDTAVVDRIDRRRQQVHVLWEPGQGPKYWNRMIGWNAGIASFVPYHAPMIHVDTSSGTPKIDAVDDFRLGDRVEYRGPSLSFGRIGEIVSIDVEQLSEEIWRDDRVPSARAHTGTRVWLEVRFDETSVGKLRALAQEFRPASKVGDHVQYIRRSDGQASEKFSHGVVTDINGPFAKVVWYGVPRDKWFDPEIKQLRRIEVPTQAEIDKALATLRAAGKVEFKPHRPPFVAEQVRLNEDYVALVDKPEQQVVKVGCQTFSFEAIRHLWQAVQRAENYNRGYNP